MTGFIKQMFIFLVQKTWKCEKHVKMGVLLHALASDKDCQLSEYLKHCTCLNVLLMI